MPHCIYRLLRLAKRWCGTAGRLEDLRNASLLRLEERNSSPFQHAIALRLLTGTSQCVSGIIRDPDALRIACLGVGRCDTSLHHKM